MGLGSETFQERLVSRLPEAGAMCSVEGMAVMGRRKDSRCKGLEKDQHLGQDGSEGGLGRRRGADEGLGHLWVARCPHL